MTRTLIVATTVRVHVNTVKKILVVTCTRQGPSDDNELLIVKSLQGLTSDVKLEIVYENDEPLPVVYNRYINKKTAKKHDIVLFAHDDLYIDDLKLRGKLYGAKESFDVVGLAGCLKPVIKKPALWHQMSSRENWRGIVNHPYNDDVNVIQAAAFGPTPSRVLMVDGLFIAINLKKILQVGWKFNENFAFHHYDLASCIDANKLALRVGVIPINVIHVSKGLSNINDINFQKSQDMFMKLYGGIEK